MKRLIIRISALAVVLAIGVFAIAQAQRGQNQSSIAIEPEVETVVTDATAKIQDDNLATTIEIMPPKPLPAKSLSNAAAKKPIPATSVLAIKSPPPVLAAANTKTNADPNPLRTTGMPKQSAASSVVLSDISAKHLGKIDRRRSDRRVMQASSKATPAKDNAAGQLPAPLVSTAAVSAAVESATPVLTAPRTLASDQVAASPLGSKNAASRKTFSSNLKPGRYATGPSKLGNPPASGNKSPLGDRYSNKSGRLAMPTTAASRAGTQKPPPLLLQSTNVPPNLQSVAATDTLPNGPGLAASGPRANAVGSNAITEGTGSEGTGSEGTGSEGTGSEGTGTPARDRSLDGAQSPQLTVEKLAPREIQVGSPANFRVVVRNTGNVTARGVEVRDRVPKGTRLMATNPRAARDVRGELVWVLGDMKPGDEKTVEAKLMPLSEGEIGSVATVHFKASASVRTRSTKPELVVQATMPKSVTIGDEIKLKITVSNPGSGVARGIVLQEQVPAGLQHPAGAELEYEIGDLKPNQSRTLELKLTAARPGKVTNVLIARGKSNLQTTEKHTLEVIAPQLKLAISGPRRRFLERQTSYKLSVSNPGTAPARDVKLQAKLPKGMRFVNANNNGHYDAQTKTVSWALAELPVNETGSVILTAMPEVMGEQKLTCRGTAEGALSVEEQKEIVVDGISAIRFDVADVEDPVEVGGETLYEIRVVNQGSKAGSNIRLEVTLPPGMQLIEAKGPNDIRSQVVGNRVSFEPLRRLSPKVDTIYQVRVKCTQAGDQRIRVQLQTDDMKTPVTKEESTKVFADN